MSDKPQLGRGNVYIKLGGIEYTLKPSVYAAKTISRKFGGLNLAVDRVAKLDFEAICEVIFIGLGKQMLNPRERQELEELIFESGFSDDTGKLGELCVQYLVALMRGGRTMTPEEQAEALAEYQKMQEEGKDMGNPPSSNNNSTNGTMN